MALRSVPEYPNRYCSHTKKAKIYLFLPHSWKYQEWYFEYDLSKYPRDMPLVFYLTIYVLLNLLASTLSENKKISEILQQFSLHKEWSSLCENVFSVMWRNRQITPSILLNESLWENFFFCVQCARDHLVFNLAFNGVVDFNYFLL